MLERGACEFESHVARERPSGGPRVSTLSAQIGCGVGAHAQLAAAFGSDRDPGQRTRIVGLSGKTALRPLEDDAAGLTLAYAMQWSRPPGSRLRADVSEVKGVLTVPVRDWLVHANLGPGYDHRAREWKALYGVALERPGGLGPLDLMAEVFGTGGDHPFVQIGMRWPIIAERLFVDASLGRQVKRSGARLMSIGAKYEF